MNHRFALFCVASIGLLLLGCQHDASRWSSARNGRQAVSGPHLFAGKSSAPQGDPFLQAGLHSGEHSGRTTAGGTFLTRSEGQTNNGRGIVSVPAAGTTQSLTDFSNNGPTVVQAGYQTFVQPAGGTPPVASFPHPVRPAGATATNSGSTKSVPTDNSGWQPRQSGASALTPASSSSVAPSSAPQTFPAATSPGAFPAQLRP